MHNLPCPFRNLEQSVCMWHEGDPSEAVFLNAWRKSITTICITISTTTATVLEYSPQNASHFLFLGYVFGFPCISSSIWTPNTAAFSFSLSLFALSTTRQPNSEHHAWQECMSAARFNVEESGLSPPPTHPKKVATSACYFASLLKHL